MNDLDPLRQMPIQSLSVAIEQAEAVKSLAGVPLEDLFLAAPSLQEFGHIGDEQLSSVVLHAPELTSLAGIERHPLIRLELHGGALEEVPTLPELTYLIATNQERALPLNILNSGLEVLRLRGSRLADCTPLADATLQLCHVDYLDDALTDICINQGPGSLALYRALSQASSNQPDLQSVTAYWKEHDHPSLAWYQAGVELQARRFHAVKDVAKRFAGVAYAVLPFVVTYEEAQALAQDCGARLVTVDQRNRQFLTELWPQQPCWAMRLNNKNSDSIIWQGGISKRPAQLRYALPILEWR